MKTLEDNIAQLEAVLRTERFGRQCRWFDTVGSTNTVAHSWARAGAGTGSLVVADFQELGRGRFNRPWTADPASNLTFSVIIDPDELRSNLEQLPIAVAVAVTESLAENLELHRPLIKWPNDVILAGRKVCGILIESSLPSGSMDGGGYVVAGVGINVNQDKFPEPISETATSLYRVLGRQVDRIPLLADILASIETVYETLRAGRKAELIRRYEAMMLGKNEAVRFTRLDSGETKEGTIAGVDASGGLRVRTETGVQIVTAGEVTIRSEGGLPLTRIARLPDQSQPTS